MQIQQEFKTIKELLQLRQNNMLQVNAEYQRGAVWKPPQKQKLIDSVMREYPLPLIYLHYIRTEVAGMQREDFEIIDGQQRIMAFYEFAEGAFALLDPIKDDSIARFPRFLKQQPCPWAQCKFDSLPSELQERFENTKISVAKVTTNEPNEVRDLFVRLQAGFPLNPQEKRDAYPGAFTDFILRLGGKPDVARYQGHDFFKRIMKMKPGQDRGKTRQMAAQIAMLFLTRRAQGPDHFTDINSTAIDDYYYTNIDFDAETADSKRLLAILDKLDDLLGDGKRPKLRAHDAIHLVLLVDSLWDDYTRSWEDTLPNAVDKFAEALAKATTTKDWTDLGGYWAQYGLWTRTGSDRGSNIRFRHDFYTKRMHEYLQPLYLKDTKRTYGPLEREIAYFRDSKRCQVCGAVVGWTEAEIHHVLEHAQGGQTTLENAVLVHKHCHPKGSAAEEFRAKYLANKQAVSG